LSDFLGGQAAGALADPKVAAQARAIAANVLASPEVRRAARPLMIEAAAWVFGGLVLYSIVTRDR
jgi:hypothetical protein